MKEGISVGDVADELGVSPHYLSKWRSDLMPSGDLVLAEKRLDALDENRKPRDEVKQLRMENEILKNGELIHYPVFFLCRVMQVPKSAFCE